MNNEAIAISACALALGTDDRVGRVKGRDTLVSLW